MILRKIKIENIRSHEFSEIIFPKGSTLLSGDIGSGKTSVLLAIEFALFGLQPSQRGSSLLRSDKEEAKVILELLINDKEVIIERKLRKKSKSITQDESSITIDGEYFEGSVTEIKSRVLSLLDYPEEFSKKTNILYKFTVYTPQEEMKQIITEPKESRLNTLRYVFGIDKYKKIQENIGILTTRLRQESRIKEAQTFSLEEKTQRYSDNLKKILEHQEILKKINEELSEVNLIKEKKQQEIDLIKEKIKEKIFFENEKTKLESSIINKKDNLININREIELIREQVMQGRMITFDASQINVLNSRIIAQEKILEEIEKEYISVETNLRGFDFKKKELKDLKDKIIGLEKCPTCLQNVGESYKKDILDNADLRLKGLVQNYEENEKRKSEIKEKKDRIKRQIESLKINKSELEIAKIKIQNLKEKELKINELESSILIIQKDISNISLSQKAIERKIEDYKEYEIEYTKKDQELKEIILREHNLLIKKAEINKGTQMLQEHVSLLEQEIKKIEEIKEGVNYLKEVEYWLSNHFLSLMLHTEKNVMIKLREEFSDLFSKWFGMLVSDALSVKLDENFSPIIQQQDYELEYEYLSGGERTAVALAYRLALNQVINSLLSKIKTRGLIILDEPTDGFSETQLDKMRDILQELKMDQIILVSHEPKIESFVDNIIKFKKENNETQVEV